MIFLMLVVFFVGLIAWEHPTERVQRRENQNNGPKPGVFAYPRPFG